MSGARADTAAAQAAALRAARSQPLAYERTRKKMVRELLTLFVVAAALISVTLHFHYRLPTPRATTTPAHPKPAGALDAAWYTQFFSYGLDSAAAPAYGAPSDARYEGPLHSYFSEGNAMMTMQHLADNIGYRVVGTQQHIDAETWLEEVLRRYEGTHATGADYATQVEVFTQQGDGAHRFDILGHPVWKQYYGMSNLIVRVSDGTAAGQEHALLINAHIDSTLPSPGAADDAAGVAIMLEALRAVTLPGAPRLRHSLILLFNNGEESLQDASHLYMTQHNETNGAVRAVVNLEACGVSGPTLLFQATDDALITAYGQVPHPFGTVLASDVFSSGVIMSDTDFRQFVEYGNGLPGLDMAIVGSSYLYHTRHDVPRYIERGTLQHFGENVLSLIESLALRETSALPKARRWPYALRRVLPIYFSMMGSFFLIIPAAAFRKLAYSLVVAVNFFFSTINTSEPHIGFLRHTLLSLAAQVLSYVAAAVAANAVAFGMRTLGMPLSWFSHEWYALLLFTPPTVAGIVGVQYVVRQWVERSRRPYLEYSSLTGATLLYLLGLLGMNMAGLGSAYLMFVAAAGLFVPILLNDFLLVGVEPMASGRVAPDRRLRFAAYLLVILPPATMGAEGIVSFLDLLVPLMGRMGAHVPVDHVMASLIAALVTLNLSALAPLCHRYGAPFMRHVMWGALALTMALMAFFMVPGVPTFDELHPRRLLVHHVENITSGEWHVSFAALDSAAPNRAMVRAMRSTLVHDEPAPPPLSWAADEAASTDMDVLFPLTHFIDTERVALPMTAARSAASRDTSRWDQFRVSCRDVHVDAANRTRELVMQLHHPALAWSTLSFDAEVLEWDFPEPPPAGFRRHHLKDVSRLGHDDFAMRMVVRLSPEQLDAYAPPGAKDTLVRTLPGHTPTPRDPARIQVHYSGLDSYGMYPHHKATGMDKLSMQTLGQLDDMLLADYPEVDAMLMSVIAGVAEC